MLIGIMTGCTTQSLTSQPAVYRLSRPIPLSIAKVEANERYSAEESLPRNFKNPLPSPKEMIAESFAGSDYALQATLTISETKIDKSDYDISPMTLLAICTDFILPATMAYEDRGLEYDLKLEVKREGKVIFEETGEGSAEYINHERMEILTMFPELIALCGGYYDRRHDAMEPLVPRTAFEAALSDLVKRLDSRRGEIIDLTKKYDPQFSTSSN